MADNTVVILADTATLSLRAQPANPASDPLEFSSGSFKGCVDERRVASMVLAIPASSKLFSLRFEFTDPSLATMDIKGVPMYLTDEDRLTPAPEEES